MLVKKLFLGLGACQEGKRMEIEWINQIKSVENCGQGKFLELLFALLEEKRPPSMQLLFSAVEKVNAVLSSEQEKIRPYDVQGEPGGLLDLTEFRYSVILPDLHARRYFLKCVLFWKPFDERTVLELLEEENFHLLCLGDGVHSEGNFASRWRKAYKEYAGQYRKQNAMEEEIADSFHLMLVVMLLKIRYRGKFNFLKGNHENILNEYGEGNYPFAKFANEGDMILKYFQKNYGEELLNQYAFFEKRLPVFAVGNYFIASHAEPSGYYNKEEIINYKKSKGVIEAFTWTDNFTAPSGMANRYLQEYLGEIFESGYYFGGHRPIRGLYNQIGEERYIQIHNPQKRVAVFLDAEKDLPVDPDRNITEVPDYQKETDDTGGIALYMDSVE